MGPLILILALCAVTDALDCDMDRDEIACAASSECVASPFICDGSPDCADGSDEDADLCEVWNANDACPNGETMCPSVYGGVECVGIRDYCAQLSRCESEFLHTHVSWICEIMKKNRLQPLEMYRPNVLPLEGLQQSVRLQQQVTALANHTLNHPRCPRLFTLVGDHCLSIFYITSTSWGEARAVCQLIGGDLLTIRNGSHFADVIQHLKENQVTSDFWVGGRWVDQITGWTWVDDRPMTLGTPFWAVRYEDTCTPRNESFLDNRFSQLYNDDRDPCTYWHQAPRSEPEGLCVALTYDYFFYMTDEACLVHKSPLCVYTP